MMHPGKYAEYAIEHLQEFRDELRDEASRALQGWAGKAAGLLLILSSVITYTTLSSGGNPDAIYTLYTYAPAIILVLFYPSASLLVSTLEKYAPLIIDLASLAVLLGFCTTLHFAFSSALDNPSQTDLQLNLSGQLNFALMMSTAFSFHARFRNTVIRNILFTLSGVLFLYLVNPGYLLDNQIQVLQGLSAGIIFSWIFFQRILTRFYYKSTDADTRQHLYNQLSKLVYPHQLSMIKAGDELEDTMPVEKERAIVNVFDIQNSSEIKHEQTKSFFLDVFRAFSQICMMGYRHNPLQSRAFRLKETGDGFISAVGYPFMAPGKESLADHSVATALMMFRAFNTEVKRFQYGHPIKAAMGLAFNTVQGTFQSSGIKSYDLFGDALIQAYRYEEIRKHPDIEQIITETAREQGLTHFNILIIQEVIYNSLDIRYQKLFEKIDLQEIGFVIRQDARARFVYFHVME
ncbi:MAG: hypothetical protein WEB57_09590 [Pseudohongiellaceae bacterium]